ncbi:MAG: hypothetical protein ACJ72D_01070 [Marmoricola sp.]
MTGPVVSRFARALAGLLVLAAVLTGCGKDSPTDLAKARQGAAMLVAQKTAVAFFTLDPDKVAKQVDAVLRLATGRFKREYGEKRDEVVRNVGTKKLRVSGLVLDGGVALESFKASEADVLVAVDVRSQESTRAATTNRYRLRLTVNRTGSTWRTSNLEQLSGVAGPGSYKPGGLSTSDDAVTRAATSGVAAALAYDYKSLDAGLAKALALMTPSFGSTFQKTFNATARPLAEQKKATTASYVRGTGLLERSGTKARCLVFVDQVLDPATKAQVVEARVFVDLERVHGVWLVDNLTPF